MREEVKRQWDWADRFLPQVERILKENSLHLIEIKVAPMEDDTQRATDMIITVKGGDVAVRVRSLEGMTKRGVGHIRELTIRSKAGGKTEIDKIREGFARWYIYGWTKNNTITEWILVDLDILRKENMLDNRRTINNADGRTGFIFIPVKELRHNNCIIAEQLQ